MGRREVGASSHKTQSSEESGDDATFRFVYYKMSINHTVRFVFMCSALHRTDQDHSADYLFADVLNHVIVSLLFGSLGI